MAQVPAAGSSQVPAQAADRAAEGTGTEDTEAGVEAGAVGKWGTVAAGWQGSKLQRRCHRPVLVVLRAGCM